MGNCAVPRKVLRRRNELFAAAVGLSRAGGLTALHAVASVQTDMLRLIAVFVGILSLLGCHGPPVQEMSDARQAIAAATSAGPPASTSPDLYAAKAAIERAQNHLEAQEYVRARLAALEAKRHAAAALNVTQHGDAQPVKAPVSP